MSKIMVNIEQFGVLALIDENKKGDVENEIIAFKNEMFADIACIIESYNMLIVLYSTTMTRKVNQVDCKCIEYKTFLQMLKYDTREAKKAYINLIKNLLVILLEHEKSLGVSFFLKYFIIRS